MEMQDLQQREVVEEMEMEADRIVVVMTVVMMTMIQTATVEADLLLVEAEVEEVEVVERRGLLQRPALQQQELYLHLELQPRVQNILAVLGMLGLPGMLVDPIQ